MKKLAGLLAFAVALAGAILLTQYYSRRPAPPQPANAAAPASSHAPSAPAAGGGGAAARYLQDAARHARLRRQKESRHAQPGARPGAARARKNLGLGLLLHAGRARSLLRRRPRRAAPALRRRQPRDRQRRSPTRRLPRAARTLFDLLRTEEDTSELQSRGIFSYAVF